MNVSCSIMARLGDCVCTPVLTRLAATAAPVLRAIIWPVMAVAVKVLTSPQHFTTSQSIYLLLESHPPFAHRYWWMCDQTKQLHKGSNVCQHTWWFPVSPCGVPKNPSCYICQNITHVSIHFIFWHSTYSVYHLLNTQISSLFPQSLWTQPLSGGQQGMFPGPKLILLPLSGCCVQPFSSTRHVQGLSTASDRWYTPFFPARGKASPPPLHSPAVRPCDGWADAGQSCAGTCHTGGRGGDDGAGEESPAGKIYHQSNHVCVTVWLLESLGSKSKLVHKSQTSVNSAKDSGFGHRFGLV